MGVPGRDIVSIIEDLAPLGLAEEWDNTGWQLGDPGAVVTRVLLALDLSSVVVKEAQEKKAELIICHHPLFMKGIKNLRLDNPRGALIAELIKSNIGVYAAHTNLDSAAGGVNEVLANKIGLIDAEVMHRSAGETYNKLVVFVPVEHTDAVAEAISRAGAGWIGRYSDCTFRVKGTGTFRPLEGTNPFIGQQGQLEKTDEVRLETIVPASRVKPVIKAMLASHPYEEVAYDLYPLENQVSSLGFGRVGNLREAVPFADFIINVKENLGLPTARVGGSMWKEIRRVAVCGGSGAEMWPIAAAMGADVFVTGDVKYHTAQDMVAAGVNFVDAGHFATEHLIMPELQNKLSEICGTRGMSVEFILTRRQSDPFMYL